MTSDALIKGKGQPIFEDSSGWVYNAVDSTHDGVLTVFLSKPDDSQSKTVSAIEFTGHDQASAPTEMPYLNSLNTTDIIRKYGQPVTSSTTPQGTAILLFRNGIFIDTRNDTVYTYGIFNTAQPKR